ncbi:MAG: hypothetical protein AAF632_09100 [Bacteroidota bacterium]
MLLNFRQVKAILCFGSVVTFAVLLFSTEAAAQGTAPQSDTVPSGIDSSLFSPPSVPIENRLNYSRNILNQSFDFKLQPLSNGKFEINISGNPRTNLSIKVYDIIGNLLYEDDVRVRGFRRKEIDLSDYKSNFFIIEIGNEEVNKTKSIVAM